MLLMLLSLIIVILWYKPSVLRFELVMSASSPATAVYLKAPFRTSENARRVKMRLGPHTVPGQRESDGMMDISGIMPSPCTDCLITLIEAGLEYSDGTTANVDSGLWLHHTVLFNMNGKDIACPHFPERIFASGNERTTLDVNIDR